MRYPPDRPWPTLGTRCLIRPPPRSASITPRSARSIASIRLTSAIRSRRANRATHLVLKILTCRPDARNYSTMNYSFNVRAIGRRSAAHGRAWPRRPRLPETEHHFRAILAGAKPLMDVGEEEF